MSSNRWASNRVKSMPVDPFGVMDSAKAKARANGLDVIDLSIGSSDLPAPQVAIEALHAALDDPSTHGYCLHSCTRPLRETAATWFSKRYDMPIDPDDHALVLIGSQEGFAHTLLALTDPGDLIIAPDPGYPAYYGSIALAGLEMATMPLLEERGFLPDLTAIPSEVAQQAKLMVISYPNNPTAAVATEAALREMVAFCVDNDIFLIHDFPYVDMVYGDYKAPSILNQPGGMDVGMEFFSCSKSYHMGGFRIGWTIGNADATAALRAVKGAVDFNQYLGIQQAAMAAINQPQDEVRHTAGIFEQRRNVLVETLNSLGWETPLPQASMYVWTRLPGGLNDSFDFTVKLAEETGVALAPGRGFGERGEGFVRFALVRDPDTLQEAVMRIQRFLD